MLTQTVGKTSQDGGPAIVTLRIVIVRLEELMFQNLSDLIIQSFILYYQNC